MQRYIDSFGEIHGFHKKPNHFSRMIKAKEMRKFFV
jgi:hypothetical protein